MSALAYAFSLIERWEGCRLEAYPDPGTGGDPWTIGYGATGPGISKGVKWTQKQADARLGLDAFKFLGRVQSLLKKPATDAQIGAMTSLAYNIGAKAFANSTLLRKFNAGDVAGAAAEFTRWNRAGGKVMKGLTNRRLDEQRVFRE